MIHNKRYRKQWIGENLIIWLLALITCYWLMEHNNFITIIVLSVIVLPIFLIYARDTGTGKGIAYFTFFAFSITDMTMQYKKT